MRTIDTAAALVAVLYRAGDPTAPAARSRLEGNGFAGAVLRDQPAAAGVRVGLRSYALRLGDAAAAREEVDVSVAEVRATTPSPVEDVATDLPDARAVRIRLDAAGQPVTVVFVTFAVGPTAYGLQRFAPGGGTAAQDEMLRLAADLRARVAAPG